MKTPDTEAGRLTELVMTAIQRRAAFDTYGYNVAWSACLEALEKDLKERQDAMTAAMDKFHRRRNGC